MGIEAQDDKARRMAAEGVGGLAQKGGAGDLAPECAPGVQQGVERFEASLAERRLERAHPVLATLARNLRLTQGREQRGRGDESQPGRTGGRFGRRGAPW